MAVGAERSLFAADQRDFCRKISGNVPPRQRKFGKLFCGEQGEKDAAVSLFFFYSIKEKIEFPRRENKCGDKEEEGARGQGRRRRGRQEGKGNDKKERRQGRQESRDNENAKVTTRKKVGAGKSRAAGRQKGFKEKIGKESAFGGRKKEKSVGRRRAFEEKGRRAGRQEF